MSSKPLFERLVSASGLSPLFAETSIERVLRRAGITNLAALAPEQVGELLPQLERTLKLFLDEPERVAAMQRLSQLAQS